MKIFIGKAFIFILSSAFIIAVLFFVSLQTIKRNAEFKINSDAEYLILGHSHPECAFNDSLIDKFCNLSQSGESYFYTYPKVRKIISQNHTIKSVFIEFSNNQIDESMDEWIWSDKYLSKQLYIYMPFLRLDDIKLLCHNNSSAFLRATSKTFRIAIIDIIRNDYNFMNKIGGYLWLNENKMDSLIANVKIDSLKKAKRGISNKNIEYLGKIVSFCQKNQIKVFFIRSPQHKLYSLRKNEKLFEQVRISRFNQIEFLNFDNFPLDNSEYADFAHLNYKGARVFSLFFNRLVKNGLLFQKNKQKYINKEINEYKRD